MPDSRYTLAMDNPTPGGRHGDVSLATQQVQEALVLLRKAQREVIEALQHASTIAEALTMGRMPRSPEAAEKAKGRWNATVKRHIAAAHPGSLSHSNLVAKTGYKPIVLRSAVESLAEQGYIRITYGVRGGAIYHWLDKE